MTRSFRFFPLVVLALALALWGCSSGDTKDGDNGQGGKGALGPADKEYEQGLNLEDTADSMKNFHCLSRYQQAQLYYDAALRKGGEDWPRRKEVKSRLGRISTHVKTLKKWKKILDKVRVDVDKVRTAGSLRKGLFAQLESWSF